MTQHRIDFYEVKLEEYFELDLAIGADILMVQGGNECFVIWALENLECRKETRRFRAVKTWQEFDPSFYRYQGSVSIGVLFYHIFWII